MINFSVFRPLRALLLSARPKKISIPSVFGNIRSVEAAEFPASVQFSRRRKEGVDKKKLSLFLFVSLQANRQDVRIENKIWE